MQKTELEIAAEKVYHEWDDALSHNDIDRLTRFSTFNDHFKCQRRIAN